MHMGRTVLLTEGRWLLLIINIIAHKTPFNSTIFAITYFFLSLPLNGEMFTCKLFWQLVQTICYFGLGGFIHFSWHKTPMNLFESAANRHTNILLFFFLFSRVNVIIKLKAHFDCGIIATNAFGLFVSLSTFL